MDITVLVPIYNAGRFINTAIECLHCQDEKNIEFLLINDGSTDNTIKEIERILSEIKDNRFRTINKKNTGYGDTLNCGITLAKGDYIGIYEPDDRIDVTFYSDLNKNKNGLDVVKYNGIYKIDGASKKRLFRYAEKEINNPKKLKKRMMKSHPAIINGIYKKSFLHKNDIKFVTGKGASYQDEQFRVSLYYCHPKVGIINKCKYEYIQHEGQSIRNNIDVFDKVKVNWVEEYCWIKKHNHPPQFFIVSCFREYLSLLKRANKNKIKGLELFLQKITKSNFVTFKTVVMMLILRINLKEIIRFVCITKLNVRR